VWPTSIAILKFSGLQTDAPFAAPAAWSGKPAAIRYLYAPTGFYLQHQAWRKNVTGIEKDRCRSSGASVRLLEPIRSISQFDPGPLLVEPDMTGRIG
jgi:hypothetical protein